MKTIFTTLFFTFTLISSFAQTESGSSKHLAFKGVPIDGTLNDYVSKMKESGFEPVKTEDRSALLKGDFASYKNCIVAVTTLKQKDLVSKITVRFPDCDTWSSLTSNYFNLKDLLTQKYGNFSECVEKFQSHVKDDDLSKMLQVKLNNCKYYTVYETDKGTIRLSIEDEGGRCFVRLAYSDKMNNETIKKGDINDL
jgi:hypothetical protein